MAEIDDSLYSRQRCVLGDEAMRKMSKSRVFLLGLGAVGIEIAKNLVLGGIEELTIQDNTKCSHTDLGTHFYVRTEDIEAGRTRAEASLPYLTVLNPYVRIVLCPNDLRSVCAPLNETSNQSKLHSLWNENGGTGIDKIKCFILTDCSLYTASLLDAFCRKHGIQFIYVDVYGVLGNLFCDFGSKFRITDPDGEPAKEFFIGDMQKHDETHVLVTAFADRRHELESGNVVRFSEINGMTELNEAIFSIEVTSPAKFLIEVDTDILSEYTGGGVCAQLIQPRIRSFESFLQQLYKPTITTADLSQPNEGLLLHLVFLTLMKFNHEESRLPKAWNDEDWLLFLTKFRALEKLMPDDICFHIDQSALRRVRRLVLVSQGQLTPLCAFFGAVAAQEAMKALTGKFSPFHQWLYMQCESVIPLYLDEHSLDLEPSRYSSLATCIGPEALHHLRQTNAFMVGCGAIGCELLKNLALLGLATADKNSHPASPTSHQHVPVPKAAVQSDNAHFAGTSVELRGAEGDLLDNAGAVSQPSGHLSLVENSDVFSRLKFSEDRFKPTVIPTFSDSNCYEESSGFESCLTITDPDHIEKSNLNRQFLFHSQHIGQSKSLVCAAAARQINPAMRVRSMDHKVSPATEQTHFTDAFLQQVTSNGRSGVVLAALDCVASRRYLDSRCVSLHLPLFESGTLGTKGHVQVVIPGLTESYNSQRDDDDGTAEGQSIPYCTLKSFPSLPTHCVEWAREKFASQFTLKPEKLSQLLTSLDRSHPGQRLIQLIAHTLQFSGTAKFPSSSATSSSSPTQSDVNWLCSQLTQSMVNFITSRPTDWVGCVHLARDKFERWFNHKARHLLHTFPPGTKQADGTPFWQLPRRQPTPIDFDPANATHQQFIVSYARLLADQLYLSVPQHLSIASQQDAVLLHQGTELQVHLEACLIGYHPPPFVFVPKTIVIDESEAGPSTTNSAAERSSVAGSKLEFVQFDDHITRALRSTLSACEDANMLQALYACHSVRFEKDDDRLAHVDFITAATNLRSLMYGLPTTPRYKVRQIAGRIVPAIATTTAAVAGLVCLELVKYIVSRCANARPLSADHLARNAFLNLALPIILLSEPAPCVQNRLPNGKMFTLWDRWTIPAPENLDTYRLADFLNDVKRHFGLDATVITQSSRMVYLDYFPTHRCRLDKPLKSLLVCPPGNDHVDLMIAYQPGSDAPPGADYVEGPPVRFLTK